MDAIVVPGLQKREDLEEIRKNISLPAITSGLSKTTKDKSGLEILKEISYCIRSDQYINYQKQFMMAGKNSSVRNNQ